MRTRRGAFSGCLLAVTLLGACTAQEAPAPAAAMLGEWRYDAAPRVAAASSLNTGLHVALVVDSVAGTGFRGRVTLWLAGDVGIAPSRFGPVTGSVDQDERVRLAITPSASYGPVVSMAGTLVWDMLIVRESWSGTGRGPFLSGDRFERRR